MLSKIVLKNQIKDLQKNDQIFFSVLFGWQCQSPGILGNWLMTSKAWNKYIFDGKTNHHHQLCRHVNPAKTGVNTSTTCNGIFKDFDYHHFKISVRLVCADKVIKNWCLLNYAMLSMPDVRHKVEGLESTSLTENILVVPFRLVFD